MSAKKPKTIVAEVAEVPDVSILETTNPEVVDIPPCPECDIHLGSKTPEVIAWWFKYHPAEADERYRGLTLT